MATDLGIWKARLLPASFRGIPFFVDTHEFTGGRNAVEHEPPAKDKGYTEDIGRKTPGYRIDGHVLGDNYFFIRDALIKAMQDGSSGFLVHPYLGVKEVQPGQFTFSESTNEGRICHFNLQFMDAGEKSFPLSILDTVTDALTAVVKYVAIAQNAFQLAYKVSQLPGYAVLSAQALLNDFSASVTTSINGISGKEDEQAQTKKSLASFNTNTDSLVYNPASLASEVDAIMQLVRDLPEDPPDNSTVDIVSGRDEKIDALLKLATFVSDASEVMEITPTRIQEKKNADAIVNLIKQLAIMRLAENAIEKEFDSLDAAVALRNQIVDLIEEQLNYTDIDDDLFKALSELSAKVIDTIPNGSVSSIKTLELTRNIPAIVLSYDLYESSANEVDIIERNNIDNPAFLSGSLEVLSVG